MGSSGVGGRGTRRMARGRGFQDWFGGFRQGKQRVGMDTGNGSSLGEDHGDVRERDVLREFGDNEDIKGAKGEKGGLDVSAKFFDGGADGFVAVMGIAKKAFTGIGCVADLMAIEGHVLPLSWGRAALFHGAPRE